MDHPRLHPDTIEQVRQTTDIVEVVSAHVVLRKRGREYVGCCPFHEEKTPSFTVSPAKGFYYCFGCGAGGNAVKFLMEVQKRSFADVVLDLAQRQQIPIRTVDTAQRQEFHAQLSLREELYEILAIATSFYEHALRQPLGKYCYDYARDTRHLSEATIQAFQLGYAPAGWQTIYDYLVEQKGYAADLVEQAGLIVPRRQGDGYYDRFRDRLMIPITDAQGRVVGFGSRTLTNEEPKYLNSPETLLFNKGKLLYGLDKARKAIVRQDQAIVVEGYFDVIALHQAGIDHSVASLGTALSQDQVKQLLRYSESKQIIFNFDADKAGQRAAERAIGEVADLAYRGEVQLRILTIPNGKDADEFLLEYAAEDYFALVSEAPLWVDWQIQLVLADKDLDHADQFQEAIQGITALLGKLPNASLRSHYIHRCAELLGRGDSRLILRLEESLRQQVRGQRWQGRSQKWQRPADYSLRQAAEVQLLQVYLHCPQQRPVIRLTLQQRDIEFSFSHHRFLWRQILAIEEEAYAGLPAPDDPYSAEWLPNDTELDLITPLQDLCTEFDAEMQPVYPLLQLDEKTRLDIQRPSLTIQAAAAALERISVEKRCRYLLQAWQETVELLLQESLAGEALRQYLEYLIANETDVMIDFPGVDRDRLHTLEQLRQDYYRHRQYLHQLDRQRCPNLQALSQGDLN